MCGLSVYLRGGHPIVHSISGLTLLFSPSHARAACGVRPGQGLRVWLPPTLAAIISKRKKVAGAAATTRHATNSSHGRRWKFREAVCQLSLKTLST